MRIIGQLYITDFSWDDLFDRCQYGSKGTHIVVWFLPISHASESLTNTHALNPMLENLDARIRRQLLTCRVQMRFPELAPCHNETCEEERTCRANVFDSMENGIEETNEWVEP